MLYIIWVIIIFSAGLALYWGTGGRAWFGTHEKPERIMGNKVRLAEIDGLGSTPPKFLDGVVASCSDDKYYHIDFVEPFDFDGKLERYVLVNARHAGYPVSHLSKRRLLAVNGTLESGRGFIALIASVK